MSVTHVASQFSIEKDRAATALAALKFFLASQKRPERFVHDPAAVAKARDLGAALGAAGFTARVVKGAVVGLRFTGTDLPGDRTNLRKLFEPIAPFVDESSYLVLRPTGELLFEKHKVRWGYQDQALALVEKIWRDGKKAAERRQHDRAIAAFERLTRVEPDDVVGEHRKYHARAYEGLLGVLAEAGRLDELEAACRRAPTELEAFAIALDHLDGDADRLRLARAGLKVNPDDARCLGALSSSHWEQSRYADYLEVLKRERAVDPRHDNRAAEAWSLLSLARYDEALVVARTWAKRDGGSEAHVHAADCLEALGRDREARRERQRALAAFEHATKDEYDGRALSRRAQLLACAGRVDEAIADAERARGLDGGDSFVAQQALGIAYLAAGRPGDAVAPLEAAVAAEPDVERARFYLAVALARSSKNRKRANALAAAAAKVSADIGRRWRAEVSAPRRP